MNVGNAMRGLLRRKRLVVYALAFVASVASAAHDTPINPDDPAYLRRQFAWFLAQDPARQQQLRKLHVEFQNLVPMDQARLIKVMQNYNAWLARLPEVDRQRVLSAANATERLDEVKRLRERDWVDSLPKAYREEYATLNSDTRRQRVQEWRAEEAERHEEWSLAQRHWLENTGKVPALFQTDGRAIDAFVSHLRENLTDPERKRLDEARAAIDEYGIYAGYAIEVVRLADAHPIFPWNKIGPRDWKELPDEVKTYLRTVAPKHFTKLGDEPKELQRAQGRWPEFALELTNYCKKNNLNLPLPLGDCRKEQMPPEVIQFLTERLEREIKKTDAGRADFRLLEEAQGKWPEYPRLIIELARKYKLPVPGWTLPGPPQFWDRHRIAKKLK